MSLESRSAYETVVAPGEITQLLVDWSRGEQSALHTLIPLIYQELHQLAQSHLRRERAGHILQPTALLHEAYLRMVSQTVPELASRAHFFGVAAHYMRQILVDHARARCRQKRGGGDCNVPLNDAVVYPKDYPEDLLILDCALDALARLDERKARLVELRYFGGLTLSDTAELMGISISTVGRELRSAEAWLRRELAGRT